MTAPNRPPKSEAENAAPRARAASPFRASGNPSSTVAWEALEPGMPMSTEVKVSEVGMTATSPTSMARADTGSMPWRKGISSDRPTMPPSPGKIPTTRPSNTPTTRKAMCWACSSVEKASMSASSISPALPCSAHRLASVKEQEHAALAVQ